jgi:hypothetical protein
MMTELYVVEPRALADGRSVAIIPLTFGRARIVIGRGTFEYEDSW